MVNDASNAVLSFAGQVQAGMKMPSVMNAETVESLAKDMLHAALDKAQNVTLDFSEVQVLTTPGIQLLLSLEKSLAESNGQLVIREVKSAVSEVFSDLGFERLLHSVS